MEKQIYESPMMEALLLGTGDVVITSNGDNDSSWDDGQDWTGDY